MSHFPTMRQLITLTETLMVTPTKSQIDQAIKIVSQKFDGFGGNCGAFAVALQTTLGGGNFVCADSGEHYEYVDHVALKWKGSYFDGSGSISYKDLRAYTLDEDGERGEDSDIFELDDPKEVMRLVDSTCGGMTEPLNIESLVVALQQALATVIKAARGQPKPTKTSREKRTSGL